MKYKGKHVDLDFTSIKNTHVLFNDEIVEATIILGDIILVASEQGSRLHDKKLKAVGCNESGILICEEFCGGE